MRAYPLTRRNSGVLFINQLSTAKDKRLPLSRQRSRLAILAWRAYDLASRNVDRQKDALVDEISRRLQQQPTCETLFSLRWRVK
jgi:hypothetical protein